MRLIDADALEERIEYRYKLTASPQILVDTLGWALRRVRNAPTIDHVKHGHWHHVKEHAHMGGDEAKEWDNFYCSECDAPSDRPYDYCPYCGSKNL